jgi:hypothetical protein
LLPDGWFETFGWDSQPRTTTDWPDISEVVAELRGQWPRLTAAISTLLPEQLNQLLGPPHDATLLVHALHDEANHQGEMWLLRKMYARLVKD